MTAVRELLLCKPEQEWAACVRQWTKRPAAAGVRAYEALPAALRACVTGQFCPVHTRHTGPPPRVVPCSNSRARDGIPCVPDSSLLISVVQPYYKDERLFEHFHLPLWRAVAEDPVLRDAVEFVMVDDASPPGHTLRELLKSVPLPAVRVTLAEIAERHGMNIGGARNTGAYLAKADTMVICDQDIQPTLSLLHATLQGRANGTRASTLPSWPPLVYPWGENAAPEWRATPADYVIPRALYFWLGGWDEDFSGAWGWDDVLFGKCTQQFIGDRPNNPRSNTSAHFVCEPRDPVKSNPLVLRVANMSSDGYHGVYPGVNYPTYLAKLKAGQCCNRGPVMRLPWTIVHKQGYM